MTEVPISRRDIGGAIRESFNQIPEYFVRVAERFNDELQALADAYGSASTEQARREAALNLSKKIDEIYDFKLHGLQLFFGALGEDRFPLSLPAEPRREQGMSDQEYEHEMAHYRASRNAALDQHGAEFAAWRIDTSDIQIWGQEFVASYADVRTSHVDVRFTDERGREQNNGGSFENFFVGVMSERMRSAFDAFENQQGRPERAVSMDVLDGDQFLLASLVADTFSMLHSDAPPDYLPGQRYSGQPTFYSASAEPGKMPAIIEFSGVQAVAKWAPWHMGQAPATDVGTL
jgi:hypothetical protein